MVEHGREDDADLEASRQKVWGDCPPRHDPSPHARVVEARLADMRALLVRMRPTSDAEALQALRAAFPGTSLSDRVAVLSRRAV